MNGCKKSHVFHCLLKFLLPDIIYSQLNDLIFNKGKVDHLLQVYNADFLSKLAGVNTKSGYNCNAPN